MQDEYCVVINNITWTLTPFLPGANGFLRTSIVQMECFSVTRHVLWPRGIVKLKGLTIQ